MKIIISLFLLWSFALPAQTDTPQISLESQAFNDFFMDSSNLPTVKGKIINGTPELLKSLKLTYECIQPQSEANHIQRAPIAADGSFELELRYAYPRQQIFIWLTGYCYFQVYVSKELSIEIDMSKIQQISKFNGQGITFGGTDGEFTTFLFRHFWSNKEQRTQLNIDQSKILRDKAVHLPDFYKACDTILRRREILDSIFLAENPSPYGWAIENIRTGEYLNQIMMGPAYKFAPSNPQAMKLPDSLWKKCLDYRGYLVSNDCKYVYANLQSAVYNQVMFNDLGDFCKELANNQYLPGNLLHTLKQIIRLYERENNHPSISQEIYTSYGEIRDYFEDELTLWNTKKCIRQIDSLFAAPKADLIKMNLIYGDSQLQKKLIELLQSNITTPWCLKILADKHQSALEAIRQEQAALATITPLGITLPPCQTVGQTKFGAHLYRVADFSSEQFLSELKKNFTGKALILEFWATWCGWCPNSLRLINGYRQALKDESVEFVYLCTSASSNEEKWKTQVAQLGIPGIHIFVDSKLNKQLLDTLSLSGAVPATVFFNKQGDYQPNAFPHHNTPENVREIKELLK